MPKIVQNGINYSAGGVASEVEVDTELSATSENPVQNKAVFKALDGKLNISDIAETIKNEITKEIITDALGFEPLEYVFATKQDIDELFSIQ